MVVNCCRKTRPCAQRINPSCSRHAVTPRHPRQGCRQSADSCPACVSISHKPPRSNDVRALVDDDEALERGILPALDRYNTEQLIIADLPGGQQQVSEEGSDSDAGISRRTRHGCRQCHDVPSSHSTYERCEGLLGQPQLTEGNLSILVYPSSRACNAHAQ